MSQKSLSWNLQAELRRREVCINADVLAVILFLPRLLPWMMVQFTIGDSVNDSAHPNIDHVSCSTRLNPHHTTALARWIEKSVVVSKIHREYSEPVDWFG
jgi:hypothetical protein